MAVCRILLVDDHQMIREGLRALLAGVPELVVVGEAENGHEAIAQCRNLQPDLVLMDINMPLLDGVSAVGMVRKRWPEIRILALTSNVSEHSAIQALQAGAQGYLLKRSSRDILLGAIRDIRAGRTFIDNQLDVEQVHALRSEAGSASGITLTERERQVLQLVAGGARNRDIAELLCISLKTVETHRLNLMKKLDAHNAAELTQWAFRLGLQESPPASQ
jgi:two-component system secretion response regulator SsrB